jgi:hypothetical protein
MALRHRGHAPAGGLALCHELSERLMAAESYVAAAQRLAESRPQAGAPTILDKAQAQLEEAGRLVRALRRDLAEARPRRPGAAAPPESDADAPVAAAAVPLIYRVCFLNHFARGGKTLTVCQREIVIRRAKSRERAIAAAKKRFARLEGIADWHIHAHTIEVQVMEVVPARGDAAPAGPEPHAAARRAEKRARTRADR